MVSIHSKVKQALRSAKAPLARADVSARGAMISKAIAIRVRIWLCDLDYGAAVPDLTRISARRAR